MSAAALEVRDLSAGYGDVLIVDELSFSVAAGGRLAVLGRNGVGKTTLMATIVGQTTRYAGSIRVGATSIEAMDGARRAAAGVGYVPQTRDIFASLTVAENLVAGLKDRPVAAIAEAYELFPRLAERRGSLGNQLSGGEQQMLSIARALLGQPSVLLLDEPLEGLAPVICDELMAILSRLAAGKSVTIVLVEQRLRAALDFADEVVILERGQIAWSGTPAAFDADGVAERHLGVPQG
jgi:branched-chain amino acid transport system ATP-binding protein